jgi:hypothetical protein
MKKIFTTFVAPLTAIACGTKSETIRAGALYSVYGSKGYFQVAKVLATDATGVHVRLYRNRFTSRPSSVDFASLQLGSLHDKGGVGIGHMPLTHRSFTAWQPKYLAESAVTEDELEGYREWESAQGGYFGSP